MFSTRVSPSEGATTCISAFLANTISALIIALVFVALPLVLAGLVIAHIRWMPTVAAVFAALYLLGAVTTAGELSNLTHVAASWPFVAIVVELLSCVLVVFAGLGATAQHNRAA